MDAIEATWKRIVPDKVFEYSFLDERYEAMYRGLAQIIALFAFLAILIACLGLFGLASFTAEQRTKEIGIRKVLGASVGGILVLLTREFARLVVVAFVVATPLAYFIVSTWLDAFAYRINLSWLIFLGVGLIALLIAMLTVGYQTLRAALADPVQSLRYE